MRGRRNVGWILGLAALLGFALVETAAAAGKPERETITFSDTFEDEFDGCLWS
jgi:hypothetical protein